MMGAAELQAELDAVRETLPDVTNVHDYDEVHRRIRYLRACMARCQYKPAPKYKENRVKGFNDYR